MATDIVPSPAEEAAAKKILEYRLGLSSEEPNEQDYADAYAEKTTAYMAKVVVPLRTARSQVSDEAIRKLQEDVESNRRLADEYLARSRRSIFELAHEAREESQRLVLIHAEWADEAQSNLDAMRSNVPHKFP